MLMRNCPKFDSLIENINLLSKNSKDLFKKIGNLCANYELIVRQDFNPAKSYGLGLFEDCGGSMVLSQIEPKPVVSIFQNLMIGSENDNINKKEVTNFLKKYPGDIVSSNQILTDSFKKDFILPEMTRTFLASDIIIENQLDTFEYEYLLIHYRAYSMVRVVLYLTMMV